MRTPEGLMARILNHLADHYKDRLILKGGILLRLYDIPRATQDIDYVFASTESKKTLAKELEKTLAKLPGISIEASRLNSRGIFIDVQAEASGEKAILEINVAPGTRLPPEPMSTATLSSKAGLSPRIIPTMALPEAFAHKIAASLERDAARDLYDLSQLEIMGTWDWETLRERLGQISIQRTKPKALTQQEAGELLQKKLDLLNAKRLEEELYPLLPPEHRPGTLGRIRVSVSRIIQRLKAESEFT